MAGNCDKSQTSCIAVARTICACTDISWHTRPPHRRPANHPPPSHTACTAPLRAAWPLTGDAPAPLPAPVRPAREADPGSTRSERLGPRAPDDPIAGPLCDSPFDMTPPLHAGAVPSAATAPQRPRRHNCARPREDRALQQHWPGHQRVTGTRERPHKAQTRETWATPWALGRGRVPGCRGAVLAPDRHGGAVSSAATRSVARTRSPFGGLWGTRPPLPFGPTFHRRAMRSACVRVCTCAQVRRGKPDARATEWGLMRVDLVGNRLASEARINK